MAAVVGFLIISFAIWGIGDIFRGFGRSTFAKIGSTEITIEQFRSLYTERLQQLGRQMGRSITLDQARAMGLDRTVVKQLIAEIVLDERVRALRLGVSDAEIARRITADPTFQGLNGQFDRQRFEGLLRQAGFTEQRYIAEQRRSILRRQLLGTVIGGVTLPKAAVEAADRYQKEERSIDFVVLDRAQAGEIEAPPPEVLAQYFEERKGLFRAPEYRKIVVVALIPGEQARWLEISDEDLKRAYEERRTRYVTPERRQIQQMVFPTADEAAAAAERIGKGETFDAIATERGLGEKDIDLGTMTKGAILDRAVADAAFALKEGEISAPVQGRFGTVLIRVVKIEPEKVPSFEEVAGELKKVLATERAKAEMLAVYDKIEDERSLGKTLAEAAEKLNLALRTIEVERSGLDRDGKPVTDLPDQQRLLAAAFTAEAGVENDPLKVEDGYVWYEVAGITPARDRMLDEVKAQVEQRWRDDEIANRLRTKAAQMLDKLKAGTSLAEAAEADGLKVGTRTGVKRGESAPPLSPRAVDAIFRTAKDASATAEAAAAGEQLVFRVTDVVVPDIDLASDDTKKLQDALNNQLSDDIFQEYIARLERDIGVTINQAGLRQVVTGQSVADDN
ncbi:MAG: peptidyl-prolyl cis-trans isomerase [Alphaproteobacteria bacterium]|nr:peptidyl-prolyl cis-trans isomerase [Alphaproteobacteria bacterium]